MDKTKQHELKSALTSSFSWIAFFHQTDATKLKEPFKSLFTFLEPEEYVFGVVPEGAQVMRHFKIFTS